MEMNANVHAVAYWMRAEAFAMWPCGQKVDHSKGHMPCGTRHDYNEYELAFVWR